MRDGLHAYDHRAGGPPRPCRLRQIKTGLTTLYPCQRDAVPARQCVDPQQVIDKTKTVIDLMKDALPLMAYLHLQT